MFQSLSLGLERDKYSGKRVTPLCRRQKGRRRRCLRQQLLGEAEEGIPEPEEVGP